LSDVQAGGFSAVPAVLGSVPRVSRRPGRVTVGIVEDASGFDALEGEWNALLEQSAASVFQSFEWQRTWWKYFGERRRDARLHIVTVRDERGLFAVAPFYVERARSLGVLTLRRLLFVGRRDSDYLDILAVPGTEAECIDLIAASLAQSPDFDMVLLEDMADRSATASLFRGAFLRQGWAASRFIDDRCPRTRLRKTWDETVASFPVNYRREIRRRLRNIAKAYPVELEVLQAGQQVLPAMNEFIAMHQARWIREGLPGVFADARQKAFHCEVADRLSRRGWLFLAFLRAGGERCAANYGFRFRDAVSTFLPGTRDVGELYKYSPGRVLHAKSMEWAIDNGYTVYDFMRGSEHYKYEFDAVDVPNWSVEAYPRRPLLTASRHRVDVVVHAVRRRARKETYALLAIARSESWFSLSLLRHLGRRSRDIATDLIRLLRRRRPESLRGDGRDAV
jgi:CelD/BcsL family acetyltransferase involved in cellulose biosynthesis